MFKVGFTGVSCEIIQSGVVTTSSSTTVAAVVPCAASQDRCQNGGFCVILFGKEIQCTCPVNYLKKASWIVPIIFCLLI